jgi:hypothetical protein
MEIGSLQIDSNLCGIKWKRVFFFKQKVESESLAVEGPAVVSA